MYLGQQEIIKEEKLDNGLIKLTLKTLEIDQLETEEEEMILHETVFKSIKSEEPLSDDTELRHIRCAPIIEKIVLAMYEYNCQLYDMDHILRSVQDTLLQAKMKHERKLYGNNELKRTIRQFEDDLLK